MKKKRSHHSPSRGANVYRARGGGLRYKGKLPRHVRTFEYRLKGKKRIGYVSKITGRRISAGKIRQNKQRQFLRERFPHAKTLKNIEQNAIDALKEAHAEGLELEVSFLEDRYKDLFKYIRDHQPDLLPKLEAQTSDFEEEPDENDFEEFTQGEEPSHVRKTRKSSRQHRKTTKRKTRLPLPKKLRHHADGHKRKNRIRKRRSGKSRKR